MTSACVLDAVVIADVEFDAEGFAAHGFDFSLEGVEATPRLRLVMTRSAPARARARPMYWPRPRLAPVTRATRPVRSKRLVHSRLQYHLHQIRFVIVEAVEPGGAFGKRRDGGDERGDFDDALRHQVDALRVFAVGGAGALEADLAGDDVLQRDFDVGREVADERDGAAFADGLDGGLRRGRNSRRFRRRYRRRGRRSFRGRRRGTSTFFGLRMSVAPMSLARSSLMSSTSTAMMRVQPAALAACRVTEPIMPTPTMTAVSPSLMGVMETAWTPMETASMSAACS